MNAETTLGLDSDAKAVKYGACHSEMFQGNKRVVKKLFI